MTPPAFLAACLERARDVRATSWSASARSPTPSRSSPTAAWARRSTATTCWRSPRRSCCPAARPGRSSTGARHRPRAGGGRPRRGGSPGRAGRRRRRRAVGSLGRGRPGARRPHVRPGPGLSSAASATSSGKVTLRLSECSARPRRARRRTPRRRPRCRCPRSRRPRPRGRRASRSAARKAWGVWTAPASPVERGQVGVQQPGDGTTGIAPPTSRAASTTASPQGGAGQRSRAVVDDHDVDRP